MRTATTIVCAILLASTAMAAEGERQGRLLKRIERANTRPKLDAEAIGQAWKSGRKRLTLSEAGLADSAVKLTLINGKEGSTTRNIKKNGSAITTTTSYFVDGDSNAVKRSKRVREKTKSAYLLSESNLWDKDTLETRSIRTVDDGTQRTRREIARELTVANGEVLEHVRLVEQLDENLKYTYTRTADGAKSHELDVKQQERGTPRYGKVRFSEAADGRLLLELFDLAADRSVLRNLAQHLARLRPQLRDQLLPLLDVLVGP